jgi:hypothetical protein
MVVTLWNFEALFAMINCVLATAFYLWCDVEGFGMVRLPLATELVPNPGMLVSVLLTPTVT